MASTSSVWFQTFTHQHGPLADIIGQLEDAGIRLAALHRNDVPTGAGIIFLDQESALAEVQQAVKAVNFVTETHIIAVSVGRLVSTSTWALLRSGVAEAFAWSEVEKPVQIVASRLAYWQALEEQVKLVADHAAQRSAHQRAQRAAGNGQGLLGHRFQNVAQSFANGRAGKVANGLARALNQLAQEHVQLLLVADFEQLVRPFPAPGSRPGWPRTPSCTPAQTPSLG